ncbi:hypothetical protein [Lysobacter sp. Root690]|uniref:hypothetical protein n=1 Tax=Lysobacter sp. Root690 TaxID=1736588 RepID=UPI0006F1E07D|nr:hypothetical protein [Lysobacter sp. Root690]KRB06701.1 hypothetical protein ASD86_11800 [Lysobacter sp. Root690]
MTLALKDCRAKRRASIRIVLPVIAAAMSVWIAGCAAPTRPDAAAPLQDSFVGTYQRDRDDDGLGPFLEISRDAQGYRLAMRTDRDTWSEPVRLYPASEHLRRGIYGYGRRIDDAGLVTRDNLVILRVPPEVEPCIDYQGECVANTTGYFFQYYGLVPLRRLSTGVGAKGASTVGADLKADGKLDAGR